MLIQAAQRAEYLLIVPVVRTQPDAVGLGDSERDLQDIDRVQPEPLSIKRGGRVDLFRLNFEVQRGYNETRQLELLGRKGAVSQFDAVCELVYQAALLEFPAVMIVTFLRDESCPTRDALL